MIEIIAKYLEIIAVWILMLLGTFEAVDIISELITVSSAEHHLILIVWCFGTFGMLLHITKLLYKH